MDEKSHPLAILYGYSSKRNEISFIGRKGLITLTGGVATIKEFLRHCNGVNSARDIVSKMPSVNPDEIFELLALCEAQGIIRDSRKLHIGFHEDSANPTLFSYDLGADEVAHIMKSERVRERDGVVVQLPRPGKSKVLDIIHNRQSVRQFKDVEIPGSKLSGLLEAAYGLGECGHWSVPSGGAMYPLDLYLIVPGDNQALAHGIYRWNPEESELIVISDKDPHILLTKVFNAKALLDHVACILCIAANLKRSASKYANRGYRYILLEAGHVAQNAYLYCAEQDIGALEYCGFNDEALGRELGLHFPDEAVITTLLMGIEDQSGTKTYTADDEMMETARCLRLSLVGEGKPIESVAFWEPEVSGYAMSHWAAIASYRPPHEHVTATIKERCHAFATGSTSSEAVLKALAEGFERYALEQRRSELTERAVNLGEPFLDPRVVVPYAPIQSNILKGIKPFDPQKAIQWIAGVHEVSGARVWVPTELVFYDNKHIEHERNVCYHASSSGVAAHFDKQTAVKTALYELIERDAISTTWYARRSVHAIVHKSLPQALTERMSCWCGLGYNVSLLDLTLDGPPVVLVAIWSYDKTPALFSGAGCRSALIDAASRAFDEAEFMAMTWYNRKPKRNMRMRDIQSPDDHGLFYINPKNIAYAEWLLNAEQHEVTVKDFDGDLHQFDPIVVDITPKEYNCGLTVVRVLSEKLMPINFGYGTEHYGHPRMDMLGFQWSMKYPSTPHFFA